MTKFFDAKSSSRRLEAGHGNPTTLPRRVSAFFLALVAVILAGAGARDQMTVAGLSRAQGSRPGVLVIVLLLALATAALAAWASLAIAPMLVAKARLFMAALALGFAGAESLLLVPGRKPEEPTQSLGALGIVLAAHQLTDAARFLIFAIALAANAPVPAAAGGAAGSMLLLAAAWAAPELFTWQRLRPMRRAIGAVLLGLALWLGLRAMGWL